MRLVLNVKERLEQRQCVGAAELDWACDARARIHPQHHTPQYSPLQLQPGTWYLERIENWQRFYGRLPSDHIPQVSEFLAPPSVRQCSDVTTRHHEEEKKDNESDLVVYITGTAAGLPGQEKVFMEDNMKKLVDGHNCLEQISVDLKDELRDKNVYRLAKSDKGAIRQPVETTIQLAAQLGRMELTDDYGVPAGLAQTMDIAAQVAVAAGLEALKNAGLVSGRSNDPSEWVLPEKYRDSTGVVYASSFPAMDAAVGEVMRCLQSQCQKRPVIEKLKQRMKSACGGEISSQDEECFKELLQSDYEFDRKFLFRVLVLGNAQLAQLAQCRGPNTQTNAACAGTTQAIAMAQDMLLSRRAQRVVVVAGDNASGATLLPWLGSGFTALGAANTQQAIEDAALPFDKRRCGMLLGAGGIGLVLERPESAQLRRVSPQARLLWTQYSNSAFHGAALDRKHIGHELKRFLSRIEQEFGITKSELCQHGVYFSHETCTHASDASSCAGNEVAALRMAFGNDLDNLLILNTKGYTGHPMGVSFEDVAAVQVLLKQSVPAIPNYKEADDYLGPLHLSKGGKYACRYALRFAAGFGSQVAFALYAQ